MLVAQIGADLAAMRHAGVTGLPPTPRLAGGDSLVADPLAHRTAVSDWDVPVLATLTAANFKFGKAYSLGRQLCALTGQPTRDQALAMIRDEEVVTRTCAWLSDLKSSFGTCATDATQLTLRQWHAWAGRGREHPADFDTRVGRQGQVWRSLLSGEKRATDVLHPGHYLRAGEELVEQYARLGWRFLRSSRWPLAASIALIAGLIGLAVWFSQTPALAAATAGLLGVLGLTGAGVLTAVKQALSIAERPIWEAQLTKAVVMVASHAPPLEREEQTALWDAWWAPNLLPPAKASGRRRRR
jgi:hypothetical protein